MKEFNPLEVRLEGSNLVEASAGTGKTFSIGILAVRLIVEKNIPVSRILMVTFTNEAVAELAARVRKFLRISPQVAEGKNIKEPLLPDYINSQLQIQGVEVVRSRLKTALMELDEASIQTIHGFCRESLDSYAFETGQAFGLELLPDISATTSKYVQAYWRKHITGKPIEELSHEDFRDIYKLENFEKAVGEELAGKKYFYSDPKNLVTAADCEQAMAEFVAHFNLNQTAFRANASICNNLKGIGPGARDKLLASLVDPELFLQWLGAGGVKTETICAAYFLAEKEKALKIHSLRAKEKNFPVHSLIIDCVEKVRKKVQEALRNGHFLTYNAMIELLHKALDNPELKTLLSNRFDAVFIDEFQDTDKYQYEIYHQLYGQNKILFYIGDPKQSIYGWRKADLETYFEARKHVGDTYSMNVNFRSSETYIDAMNSFFKPTANFDAFAVRKDGVEELPIDYVKVKNNPANVSQGLTLNGLPVAPLSIFNEEKKTEIRKKIVPLVQDLLGGKYKLNGERVKNSDIGILVRSNKEARALKYNLAQNGIRAITIDDSKIFQSTEAKHLRYILDNTLNISWSKINKALLNDFTGFDGDKVLKLDDEKILEYFRNYLSIWNKSRIYPMMRRYMEDFNVVQNLTRKDNSMGLRILTNLNHLLEVLQEAEYRQELKPSGLYHYLSQHIAGVETEGDEYEQRVESEEEAVKILTIHKAKGLEYPIVIAPFLDMSSFEIQNVNWFSFRDADDSRYYYYHKKFRDNSLKESYGLQVKQENRRLLYVAVTRAMNNCFVFKNTSDHWTNRDTALTDICAALPSSGIPESLIRITTFEPQGTLEEFAKGENRPEIQRERLKISKFNLPDKFYRKLSYSYLAGDRASSKKDNANEAGGDYEKFIYKDLPKGALLGDMLHQIFERLDFQEPAAWHEVVEQSLIKHFPQFSGSLEEGLHTMIDHVLRSRIIIGDDDFTLSEIAMGERVNELEFNFTSARFLPGQLKDVPCPEGFEIQSRNSGFPVEGLMNGFVDLFFRHKGKYYILDWKSNFLGDTVEHYSEKHLIGGMNESNYHLQYLIYSLAVKKFLESRLGAEFDFNRDFGGVIYMFLRGNRAGDTSGVFTIRPSLEQISFLEELMAPV